MGFIRIVIADDHEPSRRILHRVLSSMEDITIVGEAGNGEEFIKRVNETIPDLVLLDINMPKINGINAIKEALKINPQLKVIFITGHREHALEAFDISAVDYIVKPIDINRLKKAIDKAKSAIRVNQELTEAIHLNEYFEYHDDLCGLPNRKMFESRLSRDINIARKNNFMIAVMFIDLDRFKFINESLGHLSGDLLLREIADRLQQCVRESDMVSRQGGDEFMILLNNLIHLNDAIKAATRIFEGIRHSFKINGHDVDATISMGITMFPTDGDTVENLIKQAETAMYKAKELGRNNFKLFTSEMSTNVSTKVIMETALRKAIERNQFQVYYQPQVNVFNKQIVGAEALIRWVHPKLGLVPPLEFIPLAEETGLIISIGEWVLRTACMQAKQWQSEGFTDLRVSVNLSLLQFKQKNLVQMIKEILDDTELHPSLLELEITESIALCNDEKDAIENLKELHHLGIRIAIDDFGTGYSSLSYLNKFPIHTLKIDKVFIKDIIEGFDQTLITSIISMAMNLKFNVIAEGVETDTQFSFLSDLKCQEVQGYLFGKPMTADQFLSTLQNSFCSEKLNDLSVGG